MENMNFVKGNKAYMLILEGSNEYRFIKRIKEDVTIEDITVEVTVKSVNKKYVTVVTENGREIKFDVNDDYREKTNYSANYAIYDTKERVANKWRHDMLWKVINNAIAYDYNGDNITLEQAEAIAKILGIEEE